jgi:hypothetical protein
MTTDETLISRADATPARDDTRRSRLRVITRTGTVVALITGSLLNLAASVAANLVFAGDDAYSGEGFAANGQLVLIAPMLNLIAIPLMLLGIVGVCVLASQKSPVMSRLAVVFTSIGMAAFFALTAATAALYSVAVDAAPELPSAVLDGLIGSGDSIAFPILMFTFLIANPLGILFAVIAFLRSRVVPIWAVIALIVFAVSDFGLPTIPFFDWHVFFVVFAAGAAVAVAKSPREPWRGAD